MKSTERLSRVRNAIYGQPWMILDRELEAICEIFERNVMGDKIVMEEGNKVSYEVRDGVAIVPLMGPIFPRANMMTRMSGATSAESFRMNFRTALEDPETSAVLNLVDSPGGAVTGAFEAATEVYNGRASGKPIITLFEGVGASAAYLIGSQADASYATEASLVGSIGVVSRLDSSERMLLNAGVDSTIIKSGKLKAIGNGPVTDEQRAEMQAMVDDYFSRFKAAVSRARPKLDVEKAATGQLWIGEKAETAGLIDGITSLDELVSELSAQVHA